MRLTKENLLNFISQEEIFERYLGFPVNVKEKYRNPLRQDKTPGCVFYYEKNGKLYFSDKAHRDFGGDCFNIAQLRLGTKDFYDTLRVVNSDFRVGLDDGYILDYQPIPRIERPKINRMEKEKKIVTHFDVMHEDFTQFDLDYWNQFGITDKILKRYEVSHATSLWIGDGFVHRYSLSDPMYAYSFGKGVYKIYRPFANKPDKFRTNMLSGQIQGFDQLNYKGTLLIITSSMKDVMTLEALGYNAIALNGEGANISTEEINKLEQRYDNILVFYNNDVPGIKAAKKLVEQHNLSSIWLPEGGPKDPSDFYKLNGRQALVDIMNDWGLKIKDESKDSEV